MFTPKEHRLTHIRLPDSIRKALLQKNTEAMREFAKANPNLNDKQIKEKFGDDSKQFERALEDIKSFRTAKIDAKDVDEERKNESDRLMTASQSAKKLLELAQTNDEILDYIPNSLLGNSFVGFKESREGKKQVLSQLSQNQKPQGFLFETGFSSAREGFESDLNKSIDAIRERKLHEAPQPFSGGSDGKEATKQEMESMRRNEELLGNTFSGSETQKLQQKNMELAALDPSERAEAVRIANQTPEQRAAYEAAYGTGGVRTSPEDVQNPKGINFDNQREGGIDRTGGTRGVVTFGQTTGAQVDRDAAVQKRKEERIADTSMGLPIPVTEDVTPIVTPEVTQAGGTTPTGTTTGTPPTGTTPTGATPAGTTPPTTSTAPTSEAGNSDVNYLRNLALSIEDPVQRAYIMWQADKLGQQNIEDPMSQREFSSTVDTGGYDAIQTILDNAASQAERSFNRDEAFREKQYERQNKLLAEQQRNTMNQLQFQNDKAARDQAEANRKLVDSTTIMLALGGGFGSDDGNRQVLEAIFKGDQAIVDLNKEFGFKKADVSLAYTDAFQTASENYEQAHNTALDNFDNRVSDLSIQGISNQQAKNTAITSAYKDYVKEIKDARAKMSEDLNSAVEKVMDTISEERKSKKKDMMSTKDKLGFVGNIRKEADGKQVIKDANEIDTRFSIMQTALADFKSGRQETAVAVDQALITIFNKMLDPSSVVRESEYARTPGDLSLLQRVSGQGAKQFISGGAGLTPDVREDLVKMASRFKETYDKKLQEAINPFIIDIDNWNASYPEEPIDYSQVFNVDRIHLPESTINTWSDAANGTSTGLGGGSSLVDFFSVYAPSADNNNPKAYASAVANDLGVSPDSPIGSLDVDNMAQAIAKHEGFTSGASRLAVENNNPGNLKFIGQPGATLGRNGFAKFNSLEQGWAALKNDIRAKIGGTSRYSGKTISMSDDEEITFEGDDEETTEIIHTIAGDVEVKVTPKKKEPPKPIVAYNQPSTIGSTLL